MKNILDVREYDTIICNLDYKDDDRYKYLDKLLFKELDEFIRSCSSAEENVDASDFLQIGYKKHIGSTISVKNYVGIIQMRDGFQIQVLPKISFAKEIDEKNSETKRVFLRMLKCMKDFPAKHFNEANLKIDRMNLYEVFINMYLQEVTRLVKRGIKATYVTAEDNLNYYKGKLIVGAHLKQNIVHRERFFVSYDEYHVNRAENKLIKSTLIKLHRISNSSENQKLIQRLLLSFEKVDVSRNYDKDFAKVVIDRNTQEYEMLMQWSRVFLLNKSFATFSGSNEARALLFSMEKVFESYVAQELRKIVTKRGWQMSTQDKGRYLFDSPDIVLVNDSGRIVIMDTKWKSLIDKKNINYGISQADMYQMYAYSKKYNAPEIWLLYPVNDQMRNHEPISFMSYDVKVNVYFVDVEKISDSLEGLVMMLNENRSDDGCCSISY